VKPNTMEEARLRKRRRRGGAPLSKGRKPRGLRRGGSGSGHADKKRRGSVPHALERREGLGAGSGWSRRRRAAIGETGEGARWWGSGVARARGPAQEERGVSPGRKKRSGPPRMNSVDFDLN
jgi:hypothetical protein